MPRKPKDIPKKQENSTTNLLKARKEEDQNKKKKLRKATSVQKKEVKQNQVKKVNQFNQKIYKKNPRKFPKKKKNIIKHVVQLYHITVVIKQKHPLEQVV